MYDVAVYVVSRIKLHYIFPDASFNAGRHPKQTCTVGATKTGLSQKCFSTQITQIEWINTDYNR
jgi:hypothetical protein